MACAKQQRCCVEAPTLHPLLRRNCSNSLQLLFKHSTTTNMSINEIQDQVIDEFSFFDDWMAKYEYLIGLGKDLPIIADAHKTDEHLIRGCQSQVWLHASLDNGLVALTADSDAVITKGIISLLIRVLSHQKPEDIANADLYFIDRIGLSAHLSPIRSNGLASMVKQIKLYGMALSTKNQA